MLLDTIKRFTANRDHKELMLLGLMGVTALLFLFLGIYAYVMGYMGVFYFKTILAISMISLLIGYWHYRNTLLFASLFFVLIELEGISAILSLLFYSFVAIYPFFSVLGFFYFYSMRTALWLTFGHLLFWMGFAIFNYQGDPVNPAYDLTSLVSMLASTLVVIFVGIIYHISTEITYQRLEHADTQKELLLKEIHHRIKNNLNKMSSGLGLQILRLHRGYVDEPEEILRKNKLRIEAMSLVHEALYKSDDIGNVDVGSYIKELIDLVDLAYEHTNVVKIYSDRVSLPLEKILRLGTILNELYTNSIKHTKVDEVIHIDINFIKIEKACELIYRQVGKIEKISSKMLEESHGLGMMLVKLSAEEMGGKLTLESQEGDLRFTVSFPC